MNLIRQRLEQLRQSANFRSTPASRRGTDERAAMVDMTSNDYLGLGADETLRREFMTQIGVGGRWPSMSSSASRLLAADAEPYNRLEAMLAESYGGRPALLFNSGYHANTGLVSALGADSTLIVADRLVHASIIDGIRLSGAPFERFRHNDMTHLRRILDKHAGNYKRVLIVTESVFSMDGDSPDIDAMVEIKRSVDGAMLYVDEAHAVGVCGPRGLGLSMASSHSDEIDVIVGTFGKALGGEGAFASFADEALRDYAVNTSRSFIFSTAIAPIMVEWMTYIWPRMMAADSLRERLQLLSARLADALHHDEPSHIQPHIVGSSEAALDLARRFADDGVRVLPIRTPTVPVGTERLRFSLTAALSDEDMERVINSIKRHICS